MRDGMIYFFHAPKSPGASKRGAVRTGRTLAKNEQCPANVTK
jgi:hypothetical protein